MGFLLYNYGGHRGTGKEGDEIIHIFLLISKKGWREKHPGGPALEKYKVLAKDQCFPPVRRKRVLGNPLLSARLAAGAERKQHPRLNEVDTRE